MSDIEFWFATGSPSAYLASCRIDDIGAKHGCDVTWRVFDIRAALEAEGLKPNIFYPRKGPYQINDWKRTARLRGVPYAPPARPKGSASTIAGPLFFRFLDSGGQDAAKRYARAVFAAHFVEGRDMSDPDNVTLLAKELAGEAVDPGDPALLARFEADTAEALDNGVWGAPTVLVDGEAFWGEDRLDQVDLWLTRGGW